MHTATLLPGGKVLIAGGFETELLAAVASAELYDPSTGTFTAIGNMTTARASHTATLLANGMVLIAGGYRGSGRLSDRLSSAELYDPATQTFAATGNLSTAGGFGTATLLGNGTVLMVGTPSACCYPAATAELYDPVFGTFSSAADMIPNPWGITTAVLLSNGTALLVLCCTADQLYDPASGTFNLTGATTRIGGDGPTTTLLPNGKALLTGGDFELGTPPGTVGAELYDPLTGVFTATGNMTTKRFAHTATLLPDRTVLIAGSQGSTGNWAIASAELYDSTTGGFSGIGNMTTGRDSHTATLLLDGTVLIAGGRGPDTSALASAELYRPSVLAPGPRLFSISDDGQGQAAIWHATTGEIASPDHPAVAGEVLAMYSTSLAEGGVIPPQVAVGGRLAEILFFGDAPSYPGFSQVNFRLPDGVAPGPGVLVRLNSLGRVSNAVTIAVN
jgi:hypothetical protein